MIFALQEIFRLGHKTSLYYPLYPSVYVNFCVAGNIPPGTQDLSVLSFISISLYQFLPCWKYSAWDTRPLCTILYIYRFMSIFALQEIFRLGHKTSLYYPLYLSVYVNFCLAGNIPPGTQDLSVLSFISIGLCQFLPCRKYSAWDTRPLCTILYIYRFMSIFALQEIFRLGHKTSLYYPLYLSVYVNFCLAGNIPPGTQDLSVLSFISIGLCQFLPCRKYSAWDTRPLCTILYIYRFMSIFALQEIFRLGHKTSLYYPLYPSYVSKEVGVKR